MKKDILALIAIVLTTFMLSSCGSKKESWIVYPDNVSYFNSFDAKTLSVEQLTNVIFSEDTLHFRLIDIRTSHQFENGHLPHAINIPLHNFANDGCKKFLHQDKVINVIYGQDASQAESACMIAAHFGCKNNVAALGGYDFIENHVLKSYGIYSAVYDDEVPEFDYAKVVAETPGAGASSAASSGAPPAPKPVAHKKKKAAAGGCE